MRREYIAWFDMPTNGKLHGQSVMPGQELIRCKDCKFYTKGRCTINYSMYEDGKAEPIYCGGDEFCCWAEKR